MALSLLQTAGYSPVTANQSYYYDGIGRLQTVNFASGAFDENSENYDYYSNGWLMDDYFNGGYGQDFGGGAIPTAETSYQYDPRGDVTGLVNQLGTPTMALTMSSSFSMLNQDGSSAYDAVGNRLVETSNYAKLGLFPATSQTVNYTYDNRDELTSVSPNSFGDTYTEDAVANIYNINGTPRQIDADNEDVTSTNYDGEGNPTIAANAFAAFDPDNHLTGLNSGTYFAAQYDSGGHRTARNFNGQGWTYYVYDGDDPVEEIDKNGVVTALNGFGADGLRLRTNNTSVAEYFTYDPQGNLTQRLHLPNGGYGGTPEYPNFWSAFGNHFLAPNTAVPAGQDQVGFGGKYGYYQDPTGLYLLGCRYYDPTNARFLTRDPIGYQAGPNLYAYCEDNPITRFDPEGTKDWLDNAADFSYAAGDVISGGATKWIDHKLGVDSVIDKHSAAYKAGKVAGTAYVVVDSVAGGAAICSAVSAYRAAKSAGTITEGVYEITTASGKKYIGQSGDIDKRLAQHVAKLKFTQAEVNAAKRTQVLGGKTAREIVEQMKIFDNGGVDDPRMLNIRNSIGAARKYLMPQSYLKHYIK